MPVDINRLTEGWLELESDPGMLIISIISISDNLMDIDNKHFIALERVYFDGELI